MFKEEQNQKACFSQFYNFGLKFVVFLGKVSTNVLIMETEKGKPFFPFGCLVVLLTRLYAARKVSTNVYVPQAQPKNPTTTKVQKKGTYKKRATSQPFLSKPLPFFISSFPSFSPFFISSLCPMLPSIFFQMSPIFLSLSFSNSPMGPALQIGNGIE